MIRHMRHGSPPRLMALQSILSPNRRESLPTPSAGVRMTCVSSSCGTAVGTSAWAHALQRPELAHAATRHITSVEVTRVENAEPAQDGTRLGRHCRAQLHHQFAGLWLKSLNQPEQRLQG